MGKKERVGGPVLKSGPSMCQFRCKAFLIMSKLLDGTVN